MDRHRGRAQADILALVALTHGGPVLLPSNANYVEARVRLLLENAKHRLAHMDSLRSLLRRLICSSSSRATQCTEFWQLSSGLRTGAKTWQTQPTLATANLLSRKQLQVTAFHTSTTHWSHNFNTARGEPSPFGCVRFLGLYTEQTKWSERKMRRIKVSLDGGLTYQDAIEGVRIVYEGVDIPGEDGTGVHDCDRDVFIELEEVVRAGKWPPTDLDLVSSFRNIDWRKPYQKLAAEIPLC